MASCVCQKHSAAFVLYSGPAAHARHLVKPRCRDLNWDSNPRPGNVEFEVEVELPQHADTLDKQLNHAVEENRESALGLPIASHSVPMGVH